MVVGRVAGDEAVHKHPDGIADPIPGDIAVETVKLQPVAGDAGELGGESGGIGGHLARIGEGMEQGILHRAGPAVPHLFVITDCQHDAVEQGRWIASALLPVHTGGEAGADGEAAVGLMARCTAHRVVG